MKRSPWFNARRDPPINGGPDAPYEWKCLGYKPEKVDAVTIVDRGLRCNLCQWRGLLREGKK